MRVLISACLGCLALLLTSCPAPNAPDIMEQYRPHLVAEYLFNETGDDSSGNGNDGTLSGVIPAFDRQTRADKSFYFNSTQSSYIDCGNDATLNPPDAISVALWFKADNLAGAVNERIISKWDVASSTDGWRIRIDSGDFLVAVNGMTLVSFSTAGLDSSDWVFVVWTMDAAETRLYVNGVLLDTASPVSFINPSSMNITIGKAAYADLGYFNGCLDNIRIYDTVIPQVLVRALYNEDS